jgi:hypothetical protein
MSLLSQFFPSGGGLDSSEYGGDLIPVETLIIAGGGGGTGRISPGLAGVPGAGGGAGGVFLGTLNISKGTVCPVVIGPGGAGGTPFSSYPAPNPSYAPASGAQGSPSSFYGVDVVGGGGGAALQQAGQPGGSGGGGAPYFPGSGGQSVYMTPQAAEVRSNRLYQYASQDPANSQILGVHYTPYGVYVGFDGATGYAPTNPTGSKGGGASANGRLGQVPSTNVSPIGGSSFVSGFESLSSTVPYSAGGAASPPALAPANSKGSGGTGQKLSTVPTAVNGQTGIEGVVIVKYPRAYSSTPAPLRPGSSDSSPNTPTHYTYKFTSSGSITLPS